ncbi:hypothetical protein WICMUC_004358 [Wickerhamomyces mucosus]|uniref:Very-long-chain (3R)-3-hydroxyacyl-CoA dehydratase n=1 Tax=Wickerhamomyces mucosus TaxID=1378264 RepID=A0A9P8PHC4_9ASCO|nr:hypothetical protein WICMUC_004358 [Wickerhamomyces mucosus]
MPSYKTSPKERTDEEKSIARYLVLYNQFSAVLWAIVLVYTIYFSIQTGQPVFFQATNIATTGIQTLAVIEIVNSALGYVRAPVFTTFAQVASRLLVVWGIFQILPNSPANSHWAYISLLLAWSITEVTRYVYYAENIITKGNPNRLLTILRYNLFFVLYPTGVASELTVVYLSLDEASRVVGQWYRYFLIAVIAIYAPGFYILFTHMLKQRKKALKALYDNNKQK